MKLINNFIAVTILATVAGCSPGNEVTEADLQEVRRNVLPSLSEFEEVASDLGASSISWAGHDSVRYKAGSDYQTESWDHARLPPALKIALRSFIASRKVEAVFVHERRTNFVMRGAGIAPAGISIGVIVASGNEHGCTVIGSSIDFNGRGLLCEKLDVRAYLYLQR